MALYEDNDARNEVMVFELEWCCGGYLINDDVGSKDGFEWIVKPRTTLCTGLVVETRMRMNDTFVSCMNIALTSLEACQFLNPKCKSL